METNRNTGTGRIPQYKAWLRKSDRAGFMGDGGGFIIFMMICIVFFLFVVQIDTFIRTSDAVRDNLCKGATIAIKASIIDRYRMDYIARIDEVLAQDVFYDYVEDNMGLVRRGTEYHYVNATGFTQHWFTIDLIEIDPGGSISEPNGVPLVHVRGTLHIPFVILTNMLGGQEVSIPYDITATNSRIVYEGDVT